MYFRVAWRAKDETVWRWKSTPLTTLQALLGFLKLYGAFPRDRLRIFSSTSRDALNALLAEQNAGRDAVSVTAEQFLRERSMWSVGDTRREACPAQTLETDERRPSAPPVPSSFPMTFAGRAATAQWMTDTPALERRRLDIETGPGSDHDLPYTFALPGAVPLLLAWIRLLARVQCGELLP